MSKDELEAYKSDASTVATLGESLDSSPNYLDMDNAGSEILLILDPKAAKFPPDPKRTRYPNILTLLAGYTEVHPELNLGNGPACEISDEVLKKSVDEFGRIKMKELVNMASHEDVVAVLNFELGEAECREYHWTYLESLSNFVRDAIEQKQVVLRY